jgi:hypothetical protein
MNQPIRPPISELMADSELITSALTRAAREAVLKAVQAGKPVPAMRDGKVIWLAPEEARALLDQAKQPADR